MYATGVFFDTARRVHTPRLAYHSPDMSRAAATTSPAPGVRGALADMASGRPPVSVDPAAGLLPSAAIIIPTFRESENIIPLIERIRAAIVPVVPDPEVIVVDDNSRDGTDQRVAELALPWVRLITRHHERGLSSAVLHGCREASREAIVVMDADLSHPPEAIPKMLRELQLGADFVLGSRYIPGGSTDDSWSAFRRLNSRVATLLARPLTPVNDPMSGFFAIRRQTFLAAQKLNPLGFKIALELMVKCRCKNIREVPIHFADRVRGESKLGLREQTRYLRHLARLMAFRIAG